VISDIRVLAVKGPPPPLLLLNPDPPYLHISPTWNDKPRRFDILSQRNALNATPSTTKKKSMTLQRFSSVFNQIAPLRFLPLGYFIQISNPPPIQWRRSFEYLWGTMVLGGYFQTLPQAVFARNSLNKVPCFFRELLASRFPPFPAKGRQAFTHSFPFFLKDLKVLIPQSV